MSVKVGVRVRPFNAREKDRESVCIIEMIQNQTKIRDELGQDKTFTFDHSFWSHDNFETLPSGYFKPTSSKYADQSHVFNAVGKEILDNAWEGYHCCLFAYGQTGSGKSYSMVGYGANKGIVPISCEEIFTRIKSNTDAEKSYEVQVSMLEIYNEKVQDLLVPANKRPTHGLKVRESKVLGIFVEGLTKYPVTSYEEISKKMDEGYENRTIGSTLMNATSSRAHTIVIIEFKQVAMIAGKKSEKLSMINLVDLAGSERAGSTGATGDRLKEGCNINKSLLVLGNVINALADKALGKKTALPPYRDSALTRILQNALGGNSKTVMICALSPASINYEETLSTLRYADRAKKIQNKAVVNESEHDKMVRLLKEENTDLKKMIEDLQKKLLGQGGSIGDEDKKQFAELKEQYDANQRVVNDMQKTFEERVEEAKKNDQVTIEEKVDITAPHLVVLNEDPQLSHKLKYSLKNLPIYVGRKHGNPPPQIILSGIGIKQNHAVFIEDPENAGSIILKPNEKGAQDYIYINGKKQIPEEGIVLQQKDRIIFGTNTILLYLNSSDGKDLYEFDWEKAQLELQMEIDKENKRQKEEIEKQQQEKMNLMKQNFEEEYERKNKEMKDKFEKHLEESKEQLRINNQNEEKIKLEIERQKQEEILKKKFDIFEAEKQRKKQEQEKKEEQLRKEKLKKKTEFIHNSEKLENTLFNILKKISKINIIINELRRNIKLDVYLQSKIEIENQQVQHIPTIIIRIQNYEEGTVYYWTPETFHHRYDLMKDLFDKFSNDDFDLFSLKKEDDPLYDEPKPTLLGYAIYKLEPVAYLISNRTTLPIISPTGNKVGELDMDIIPHDDNGCEFDEVPEQPNELIGQPLRYKVCLYKLSGLNEDFCSNIQIEYKISADNSVNRSKVYNESELGKQVEVEINETFEHYMDYLSEEDIEYFEKGALVFNVYAYEQVDVLGKLPARESKAFFVERETLFKQRVADNEERKEGENEITTSSKGKDKKEKGHNKDGKEDKRDCVIF